MVFRMVGSVGMGWACFSSWLDALDNAGCAGLLGVTHPVGQLLVIDSANVNAATDLISGRFVEKVKIAVAVAPNLKAGVRDGFVDA
jgi:hypothetical protein